MKSRWLVLALAGGLLACVSEQPAAPRAPVSRPVVERLSAESVRIRWPAQLGPGPVTVYAGVAPERIDHTRPMAVAAGGEVVLDDDEWPLVDDDYRLFYELVPQGSAESVLVAERRLPLRGADNFRDLGGYATRDGRQVRWGRVYRANSLAGLTRSDVRYLAELGIKLVCDMRSEDEVVEDPDRVLEPLPPDELLLDIGPAGMDPHFLRESIRTGGIAALGVEPMMRDAYRAFATDYTHEWSELFARLADPDQLPAVFHCTAGKDRTGFAAALLLLALGVPEETVFEDYLITNRYRARFHRTVLRWVPLYSLFRTDPDDLLPLLEARREYLEASLDTIRGGWGSVDAYLEQALGVTAERRQALRALLLEPSPEPAPAALRASG